MFQGTNGPRNECSIPMEYSFPGYIDISIFYIHRSSTNSNSVFRLYGQVVELSSWLQLYVLWKTSFDRMDPISRTFRFAYGPVIKPSPSLSKISYKYNSILTYIPVSFLFSFKKRVRVRVKNRGLCHGEFRLGLGILRPYGTMRFYNG